VTKIINQIIAEVENGPFGMKLKAGRKGRFNPGRVELTSLKALVSQKMENVRSCVNSAYDPAELFHNKLPEGLPIYAASSGFV
jgi:hypothetical protein